MKQYTVTGMNCAACSARVEKAVLKVEGVTSCSVSLLTNSMAVEGTASPASIIKAVKDAGYGAKEKGNEAEKRSNEAEDALEDHETPKLKKRLAASVIFLLILMYFSMGHMMWNWPLPPFFEGNHVAMGLVQLLFTVAIMVVNQKFFVNGFKGLIHRAPNMDTLVALGSAASFIYSVYALFAMTDAVVKGQETQVMHYMHEFYFESAAMILTLITVGKMLEAKSKGRTTDALKGLMKLAPKTAVLVKDGVEQTVPIEQLHIGDLFAARPGENIPEDGFVKEGNSAVNESALTGESVPVNKDTAQNRMAYMSTNVTYGRGVGRVSAIGMDTEIGKIAGMLKAAKVELTPLQKRLADLGKILGTVSVFLCVLLFGMAILQKRDVGEMLITAISLAVAAVPEGLPAIVTMVLALSVSRMVKVNAIVKRLPCVETL